MPRLKYYNETTQQWEHVIVGGQGPQGDPGPGLASGGTAGQIVAKVDGTDFNTEWTSSIDGANLTIKVRKDTADNWTTNNPTIASGELAFESDTGLTKIGNGTSAWTSLAYTASSTMKQLVAAGEALTRGQAVYASSSDGTHLVVSKASNATEATSSKTLGLINQSLASGAVGRLVTEGTLNGLNTSSASAGDPVWLGTNGNLIYGLAGKPKAPAHLVFIGIVTVSHASNGSIYVRPQNGFELDELHDVSITSPAAGEIVSRNSANTLWENMTLAEAGVSAVGHTHDDRYYTETETDNAISVAIANVVDTAPALMDTLNELSASLNDDPSFATTVANALAALVPSGTINQTARATAPTGYLLCDGSAVSRTTYSSLFDAIGTAYGTGNGSTTFNIPNLKGKIPVGYDSSQTEFDALGETGGAKTVTLDATQIPAHTHSGTTGDQSVNHTHGFSGTTANSGTHSHTVRVSGADDNNHTGNFDGVADSDAGEHGPARNTSSAGDHNHTFSGTTNGVSVGHTHNFTTDNGTGGGLAHNNLQPYIVLNYMIKI